MFYDALKTDVVFDAQIPALSSQGQGCYFTLRSVGARRVGYENRASLQGILTGNQCPAGISRAGRAWEHEGPVPRGLGCSCLHVPSC